MGKTRKKSFWTFKLYISGQTSAAEAALENHRRLADQNFPGKSEIEVIDLQGDLTKAQAENIIVTPFLVCENQESIHQFFGDFSEADPLLDILGVGQDA